MDELTKSGQKATKDFPSMKGDLKSSEVRASSKPQRVSMMASEIYDSNIILRTNELGRQRVDAVHFEGMMHDKRKKKTYRKFHDYMRCHSAPVPKSRAAVNDFRVRCSHNSFGPAKTHPCNKFIVPPNTVPHAAHSRFRGRKCHSDNLVSLSLRIPYSCPVTHIPRCAPCSYSHLIFRASPVSSTKSLRMTA
jgi:hypothetical protein